MACEIEIVTKQATDLPINQSPGKNVKGEGVCPIKDQAVNRLKVNTSNSDVFKPAQKPRIDQTMSVHEIPEEKEITYIYVPEDR
jgi:hypothetical protein